MSQPYKNKCHYPFLLYPPTLNSNAMGHSFVKNLGTEKSAEDYVLYVSIPFCRVRCKSCPYFINILSEKDSRNQEARYVDALINDIKLWAQYPRWRDGKLRAIYIGGGTGSILKTENLKRVVDAIFENFPVVSDYSLTLEGNAGDYDDEKLDYVANSPINRISLGVQSFHEPILRVIGSPHAAEESTKVIRELQKRGMDNIQLDLMFNMPGHNMNVWQSDLQKLNELDIKHFTIYLYRIHGGTVQERHLKQGLVPAMEDRESPMVKEMYQSALEIAKEHGFEMYMFDHFAKPGYESAYNRWTFKEARDALGIGAGAYSFINDYRTGSEKDVEGYIAAVNQGQHLITAVSDKMTMQVRKERYIIFAFQYFCIEFDAYQRKFGSSFMDEFAHVIENLKRKELITIQEDKIELTQLGRDWHMNVFLEFFSPDFWGNTKALNEPNWAMNIPMVKLASKQREYWLASS